MSNADLIKRLRDDAKIGESGATCIDYSPVAINKIADALEAADKRIDDLADQLAHCQTSRQKAREEVLRVLDKRLAGKDQGK